jgi:hypothetical protein
MPSVKRPEGSYAGQKPLVARLNKKNHNGPEIKSK